MMATTYPASCVIVPRGWLREVEGPIVYYVSPDNQKLTSLEEVTQHLVTPGTCKCGLRCPINVKDQFSFDPEALSLPDHSNSIENIQGHCKLVLRARLSSISLLDIPENENKIKQAPITNTSKSPPKKILGTKRTMSYALFPEVRLEKKVKLQSRTSKPKGDILLPSLKVKHSESVRGKDVSNSEQLLQSQKKLLSLLRKTSDIASVKLVAEKKQPVTIAARSSFNGLCESITSSVLKRPPLSDSESMSPKSPQTHSHLQDILKKAKHLSKIKVSQKECMKGQSTDSEVTSPTPIDVSETNSPIKVESDSIIHVQEDTEHVNSHTASSELKLVASPSRVLTATDNSKSLVHGNEIFSLDQKETHHDERSSTDSIIISSIDVKDMEQSLAVQNGNVDSSSHISELDDEQPATQRLITEELIDVSTAPSDDQSTTVENIFHEPTGTNGNDLNSALALTELKPQAVSSEQSVYHDQTAYTTTQSIDLQSLLQVDKPAPEEDSSMEANEPTSSDKFLPETIQANCSTVNDSDALNSDPCGDFDTECGDAHISNGQNDSIFLQELEASFLLPSLQLEDRTQDKSIEPIVDLETISNNKPLTSADIPSVTDFDSNDSQFDNCQQGFKLDKLQSTQQNNQPKSLESSEEGSSDAQCTDQVSGLDHNSTLPTISIVPSSPVSVTLPAETLADSQAQLSDQVDVKNKSHQTFDSSTTVTPKEPDSVFSANESVDAGVSTELKKKLLKVRAADENGRQEDFNSPNSLTTLGSPDSPTVSSELLADIPKKSSKLQNSNVSTSQEDLNSLDVLVCLKVSTTASEVDCVTSKDVSVSEEPCPIASVNNPIVSVDMTKTSPESQFGERVTNDNWSFSSISITTEDHVSAYSLVGVKADLMKESLEVKTRSEPNSPVNVETLSENSADLMKESLEVKARSEQNSPVNVETLSENSADLMKEPLEVKARSEQNSPVNVETLSENSADLMKEPLEVKARSEQNSPVNVETLSENSADLMKEPLEVKAGSEPNRPLNVETLSDNSADLTEVQLLKKSDLHRDPDLPYDPEQQSCPSSPINIEVSTEFVAPTKGLFAEQFANGNSSSGSAQEESCLPIYSISQNSPVCQEDSPDGHKPQDEVFSSDQGNSPHTVLLKSIADLDSYPKSPEMNISQNISRAAHTHKDVDDPSYIEGRLSCESIIDQFPKLPTQNVHTTNIITDLPNLPEQQTNVFPTIHSNDSRTKLPINGTTISPSNGTSIEDTNIESQASSDEAQADICSGNNELPTEKQTRNDPITSDNHQVCPDLKVHVTESQTDQVVSELPMDTVVEQYNDEDQQSVSAIITSSGQCRSGTPFSSACLSSPFSSTLDLCDNGSESVLSASRSSDGCLSLLTNSSENSVKDQQPNTSQLEPKRHKAKQSKAQSLSTDTSGFSNLLSYPIRRTRSSVSKIARESSSSISELKSPSSETGSIADSVFEAEQLSSSVPKPKKRKRSQGTSDWTCSRKRSRSLTVSLPRSSVHLPTLTAQNNLMLSCHPVKELDVGNIVWAKAPLLPGWPGKIISYLDRKKEKLIKPPPNKTWVEWFGSSTFSLVDNDAIKPLEEGIKGKMGALNKKKLPKKLEKSIQDARDALEAKKKAEGSIQQ